MLTVVLNLAFVFCCFAKAFVLLVYFFFVTMEPTSHQEIQQIPKWFPKFRGKPFYNGNVEALAWVLDSIGRA